MGTWERKKIKKTQTPKTRDMKKGSQVDMKGNLQLF